MSEWQTIDSAPQDGTRVLLYWPSLYGGEVVRGWFNDGEWQCIDYLQGDAEPPTHWMPLPAPPVPLKRVTQGDSSAVYPWDISDGGTATFGPRKTQEMK